VNRAELVASMNRASSEVLRQKGYISFVDILIQMGKLTKEDYDSWRMKRISYLERAIRLNLSQISHLLRTLRQNAVKGHLQPSKTAYVSWGKGAKRPLRFSKSGHPAIEEAYSTHFVKRKESVEVKPSDQTRRIKEPPMQPPPNRADLGSDLDQLPADARPITPTRESPGRRS
jgi:hypothetical protein